MSGRVLAMGYDPGDVYFAAPASYVEESRQGDVPSIMFVPYFLPIPGYWEIIKRVRGADSVVVVGRLSCLITNPAVARLADSARRVVLYTNHYCYERINRMINGVSRNVKVLPLDRTERFQVDRSLMKNSWIVLRHIAGMGDPDLDKEIESMVVELAERWKDSMDSEEVDYGNVVEHYARALVRKYRDEAETAITQYMDSSMELVIERKHVKVFVILEGGRRLSYASVAARLHAESVGKIVVALRYSANLHYMVIAVPDEERVAASRLARDLDKNGPIRRRIYDAGKRIFEGLVSLRVRQGRAAEAIVESIEAALARA